MDEREGIITERLQQWAEGRPAGPYKIILNPTNRCNLDCISCLARGRPDYNPEREVTVERYLSLIKEAKRLGVRYCDICGGEEPFARPAATLAIMQEVKGQGMTGMVITNGTLLTEDLVKRIVKMGWDEFNISIDGPTAGVNNPLRGKGTFDRIVRMIESLNRWKKRLKTNRPRLSFFTVVSRKNYRHIGRLIELATRLHVEGLYLQPVRVENGRSQELVMTEEDASTLNRLLGDMEERLSRAGIASNIGFIDRGVLGTDQKNEGQERQGWEEKQVPCHHPWLMAVVTADGAIGLCPGSVPFTFKANIQTHGLEEVWRGEEFRRFRRKILVEGKHPCCEKCGSMEKIANLELTRLIHRAGQGS